MSDFLDQMVASGRRRADQLTADRLENLAEIAHRAPGPIGIKASSHRFDVIAEAKLRSPASGRLTPAGDDIQTVVSLARAYEAGGAAAISVLTEPSRFDGDLSHLSAVADAVSVPVMRKDFLVDPAQLVESRAHGAAGVLLIARILGPRLITRMIEQAREMGMFALIELFGPEDLEIVNSARGSVELLGVNARDLSDLSVRYDRLESMARVLPADVPWVAESGLTTPEDAADVAHLGYGYALVGTGLASSADPTSLLRDMIAAGRAAREGDS